MQYKKTDDSSPAKKFPFEESSMFYTIMVLEVVMSTEQWSRVASDCSTQRTKGMPQSAKGLSWLIIKDFPASKYKMPGDDFDDS